MEALKSEVQKPVFDFRRRVPVAGGYALRRVRLLNSYAVASLGAAMVHVEAILASGHCASMANVSGQFLVKEMVLV